MPLSDRVASLLQAYRETESASRRGPRFRAVAEALQDQLRSPSMSPEALVEWFGIPDLWTEHNGNGLFVYFFGYHKARTSRHEWYFYLDNGRVWQSGFNERGINDLTHLKTALEWPERKT